MARGIRIDSRVSGPFFNFHASAVDEASRQYVKEMTKEGEAKVEAEIRPGHGFLTGAYKSTITGEIKESKLGIIDDSDEWKMAIRGKWLEGVTSRNQSTQFKGYHMWRKATAHLKKISRQVGGKVYKRMAQRLT